jgi:hypothetical protein
MRKIMIDEYSAPLRGTERTDEPRNVSRELFDRLVGQQDDKSVPVRSYDAALATVTSQARRLKEAEAMIRKLLIVCGGGSTKDEAKKLLQKLEQAE